jgi:hypothetical protein
MFTEFGVARAGASDGEGADDVASATSLMGSVDVSAGADEHAAKRTSPIAIVAPGGRRNPC